MTYLTVDLQEYCTQTKTMVKRYNGYMTLCMCVLAVTGIVTTVSVGDCQFEHDGNKSSKCSGQPACCSLKLKSLVRVQCMGPNITKVPQDLPLDLTHL